MKNLLGLPEFNVVQVLEDTDGRSIKVQVEVEHRPYFCPICGSVNAPHKHSSKQRLIRDLHIAGKLVYLDLKVQRYRCKDCEFAFSDKFTCIDENIQMTNRLREHIKQRCLNNETFLAIANDYCIADKTVRRIFDEYVAENEQLLKFKAPRVLGIDEAHIDKRFRLIVTDTLNNQLLDMLPNNSTETVCHMLNSLNGKEDIKVVTMDFARHYANAVESILPNAKVVIDKFHVIQLINRKMDVTRKDIHNQAKKNGINMKRLKNERKLFMANLEDLSTEECQKLTDWFKQYPSLEEVYMLKEQFREIYLKAKNEYEASILFDEWCKSVPKDYPEFVSLKRTFMQRRQHILNYFAHRQTNAYTESINNYIKKIEKNGNGYRFEVLRARALFSTKATKPPKFEPKKATYEPSHLFLYIDTSPTLVEGFHVDLEELMQLFSI